MAMTIHEVIMAMTIHEVIMAMTIHEVIMAMTIHDTCSNNGDDDTCSNNADDDTCTDNNVGHSDGSDDDVVEREGVALIFIYIPFHGGPSCTFCCLFFGGWGGGGGGGRLPSVELLYHLWGCCTICGVAVPFVEILYFL